MRCCSKRMFLESIWRISGKRDLCNRRICEEGSIDYILAIANISHYFQCVQPKHHKLWTYHIMTSITSISNITNLRNINLMKINSIFYVVFWSEISKMVKIDSGKFFNFFCFLLFYFCFERKCLSWHCARISTVSVGMTLRHVKWNTSRMTTLS